MRTQLRYDDVILVSAVARTGSVRGAAAHIGAHVATLYRRLRLLEVAVAGPLFERTGTGLKPTPVALDILAAADTLELRLLALNRQLMSNERLQGELVVTTTDSLVPLVCDAISHFQNDEPEVVVRLSISRMDADMARNEADIAIRATRSPPETLVGQRVAQFDYVTCEGKNHAQGEGAIWVALDGALSAIPAARWVANTVAPHLIKLRVDSMDAAASAVAAGLGRAVLPTYMVPSFDLSVVGGPISELASEVWMLTHPELRSAHRVRAFMRSVSPYLRHRLRAPPS